MGLLAAYRSRHLFSPTGVTISSPGRDPLDQLEQMGLGLVDATDVVQDPSYLSHPSRRISYVLLADLISQLAELVALLDPSCVTGSEAARLTKLFDRGERLCASAKTLVAARAIDCGEWSRAGTRSPEEWLARTCGTGQQQARSSLQIAAVAQAQPEMDQALRVGRLSVVQAGHIASAAAADPSATSTLIDHAGQRGLKGLREECRAVEIRAAGAEEDRARAERLHRNRYLRLYPDHDGAGRVDGRLAPEAFARLRSAITPFERAALDQARTDGRRESFDAYRADALVAMAEAALYAGREPAISVHPSSVDHAGTQPAGTQPASTVPASTQPASTEPAGTKPAGTEPAGTVPAGDHAGHPDRPITSTAGIPINSPAPGGRPRPRPRSRIPTEIIAVIDYAALARGHVVGGERSYIEGIGPVPVSVIAGMTSDAFIAAVVTEGTDIRSVTHLGRHPTRMQRTALHVRDPKCVVPGCDATAGLEVDHCPEWADTHHTTLDELARLCSFHHDQKTYQGAVLSGGPGRWIWKPPPPGPFDEDPGP